MKRIENVLVVDDDAVSLYITQRVLKNLGLGNQLLTATNGQEGLAIIQQAIEQGRPVDLVLVDIKMPVMDGFTFIAELEKLGKVDFGATRIVILSSSCHPADQARTERETVTAFLQKPLTKEKLCPLLN